MKEVRLYTFDTKKQAPLLVLIDTEWFDCEIVKVISPSTQFLPEYILFEHKQCKHVENEQLRSIGYIFNFSIENTLAFGKIVEWEFLWLLKLEKNWLVIVFMEFTDIIFKIF